MSLTSTSFFLVCFCHRNNGFPDTTFYTQNKIKGAANKQRLCTLFTYLLVCFYQSQCLFLCSFYYLYQVGSGSIKTSKPYHLIAR